LALRFFCAALFLPVKSDYRLLFFLIPYGVVGWDVLWKALRNIIIALGVKFLVLALATLGLANMWEAVFAAVGVSVMAILNASRALNLKRG
jgi:hypothetical protein